MNSYTIKETGNIQSLPAARSFELANLEQAKTRAAGMQRYSSTVMIIQQDNRVIARRYQAKWEVVQ